MLGSLSFRNYLLFGIMTAVIFFAIGRFAGPQVAQFVNQFRSSAIASGFSAPIAGIFCDPIIWALNGEWVSALIGGLLWPVAILWVILFILLVVISFVGGGVSQVQRGTMF